MPASALRSLPRRSSRCFRALAALAVIWAAAGGAIRAQSVLVVDDDGHGSAVNCASSDPAFSGIQAAVNAAQPGDTIFMCPGVYDEQVVVTTAHLTLVGAGAASTIIRPSVAHADTGIVPPIPIAPILLIDGAADVAARDFTVDGSAADGGAANLDCATAGFYIGVFAKNSSGVVRALHVTGIRSATRCSLGLFARSDSGGVTDLSVVGDVFDDYGSGGVACSGPNTTCVISDNRVIGRGPVDDELQAGINIRFGATATILGNVIRDHFFLLGNGLPNWSVGIFLVSPDPKTRAHLLRDNSFADNQLDVQQAPIVMP